MAISTSLRKAVLTHYGFACACCGCADAEALHIDHVIARANGGTDEFDNLQVLCQVCNSHIKREIDLPKFEPIAPAKRWGMVPKHAHAARARMRAMARR